ncbi:hypothetical protein ACSSS7_005404 [Eimeria intestinalis]
MTSSSGNSDNGHMGICTSSRMTALASGELLVERTGKEVPVHVVTLNRPQALNALSLPMLRSLLSIVEDKAHKDALAIFQGSGDKAFCAEETPMASAAAACGMFCVPCAGGGVGLSAHGGLRICTEKTTFSMPEVRCGRCCPSSLPKVVRWQLLPPSDLAHHFGAFSFLQVHIGLFPDCGMTQRLASLQPAGLGLFLGLTGAKLKAPDLMRTGLATHYVPCSELEHALEELKQGPPRGTNVKEWACQVLGKPGMPSGAPASKLPEAGLLLTSEMLQFLKRYFAKPKSLQNLLLSLKEGAQSCPLCASALQQMESACPLSLVVTFKAIKDRQRATAAKLASSGGGRDTGGAENAMCTVPSSQIASEQHRQHDLELLLDAMATELVLICNMTAFTNYNFKEGIRALLLDKDKNPKWYFRPSQHFNIQRYDDHEHV